MGRFEPPLNPDIHITIRKMEYLGVILIVIGNYWLIVEYTGCYSREESQFRIESH